MNESHVLLRTKAGGQVRPYAVMSLEEWGLMCSRGKPAANSWEEVTRGTEEELLALAKLMPEKRVLI